MPMHRSQLRIPLSAGLSEKSDSRTVNVDGAARMTNCVMQKAGAVRKRFGHTALSKSTMAGGTIAAAVNGGSYKTAPWLSDGSSFYQWSEQQSKWATVDTICDSVALDRLGLVSLAATIVDYDQAYASGLVFAVFTVDPSGAGFGNLYWTAVDPVTHAVVVPVTVLDSTINSQVNAPKLVVCGTTVVLTYVRGGNIAGRVLDSTNVAAGWSVAVNLATDGVNHVTSGVYDTAATSGSTTLFALAYETASGIAIKTFSPLTMTVQTSQTADSGMPAVNAIAVVSTSGEWHWAVYHFGSGHEARAWAWRDGNPATHAGPFEATGLAPDPPGRLVAARISASQVQAYCSSFVNTASAGGDILIAALTNAMVLTTAAAFGSKRVTWPHLLLSKPIVLSGVCYLGMQIPSVLQGTALLCRDLGFGAATGQMRPVATLDPRLAKYIDILVPSGSASQSAPHILSLASVGSTVLGLAAMQNTSPTRTAIYEYPIDTGSPQRYQSAELYELEAIGAGVPQLFDGQAICEVQFLHYPEIQSTTFGAAGSMQTSGLYQYIATYEWTDARGQIHRSAVSPPFEVSATGSGDNGSCVVVVPGIISQRSSDTSTTALKQDPAIVLYRTQANGSIFYRTTGDPPDLTTQLATAIFVSITDTTSDADLATQPLLYTTGGTLENFNPPSGRICIAHRNRWWIAGCPDPTAIWPSKEITPGEAPGFNEAMNFTASGAVRGLASQDDKLVVFVQRGSRYGIEFITGEGPGDTGAQNDWTPPQPIPSDVGATDQRSIVTGPFGTLFRSIVGGPTGQGGIFLLSRDLQVSYISGNVEDTLSTFPVVTSATISPTRGRVYFTCTQTDSGFSSGVRLVWDYDAGGVWSVDQIADPDTAQASAGARCAFVAYSSTLGTMAYHWATLAGRVYRETNGIGSGSYLDAGAWVPMTYATAFVRPQEGAFYRFWRVLVELDVLETANPPDIQVQLTFDGADALTYAETDAWTGVQLAASSRFPQFDTPMIPLNQKAKSIQVTISDSSGGPIGQGISIGGIVLDVGDKGQGYQNIPPAQRG